MVSKILKFGNQKGSSTLSPAHGLGGARATILSFLYSVPPSVRKKFWPSNQAGEKEGGWGEGIFARPRFPIPIFPPPPNFVFRFAKCAAKKILFDLLLKISYTNDSKWKWYL